MTTHFRFRTVQDKLGPMPNACEIPKILCSFPEHELETSNKHAETSDCADSEIDIDDLDEGSQCLIRQLSHKCTTDCLIKFDGLSLYNDILLPSTRGPVPDKIECAGEWFSPWVEENMRLKMVRDFKKDESADDTNRKLFRFVFYCYKFKDEVTGGDNSEFVIHECGEQCPFKPQGYCILYPKSELTPCVCTYFMDRQHGYCESLQHLWEPVGIIFLAHSDVRPFQTTFDVQIWKACQIIIDHLIHVDDYIEMKLLLDLLSLMDENYYSRAIQKGRQDYWKIHSMRKVLRSLLPYIISYDECATIRTFDDILFTIAANCNILPRADLVVFADNVATYENIVAGEVKDATKDVKQSQP